MDFIVTALITLLGLGFALAAATTSPLLCVAALGGTAWFVHRQANGWR